MSKFRSSETKKTTKERRTKSVPDPPLLKFLVGHLHTNITRNYVTCPLKSLGEVGFPFTKGKVKNKKNCFSDAAADVFTA